MRTGRDACLKHDPFDKLPGPATRERPESCALIFMAVDLSKHTEQFGWHGHLAEYDSTRAFLQRSNRNKSSVALDRTRFEFKRLRKVRLPAGITICVRLVRRTVCQQIYQDYVRLRLSKVVFDFHGSKL